MAAVTTTHTQQSAKCHLRVSLSCCILPFCICNCTKTKPKAKSQITINKAKAEQGMGMGNVLQCETCACCWLVACGVWVRRMFFLGSCCLFFVFLLLLACVLVLALVLVRLLLLLLALAGWPQAPMFPDSVYTLSLVVRS